MTLGNKRSRLVDGGSDEIELKGSIKPSDKKEIECGSGSMSSDENGPKGGIISPDQKEIESASGSMSSDENGPIEVTTSQDISSMNKNNLISAQSLQRFQQ